MSSSRAPWWMYIIAASFLGLFALRIYVLSPLYPGPGPIGFRFDLSSSTLTVLGVEPNGIGQRAGLRAGDHIVAVNGVNVGRLVEWDMANYALVYQQPSVILEPFLSVPFSFAVFGCYVLGGLIVLVMNYRRLKDINERRRVRVLVVGSVVGWVAAGTFLAFIVKGGGRVTAAFFSTPVAFMVLLLFPAFPLSFAYAILRHRAFDLGLIIRRGLQYTLARGVLLTAVPALGVTLLTDLLLHGQQPLLEILRARGWIYVVLSGLAATAYASVAPAATF